MHRYTRTTGKKLTYDIDITGTGYLIRHDGKVLKDETEPMVCEGEVRDRLILDWAIRDIEELDGMPEE